MCRLNHTLLDFICLVSLMISAVGRAEVVFDNSLGLPVTPNTLGGEMVIPEGRGAMIGSNLFHSFQDFNINTGESATFTGQSSVVNILGRVTGNTVSNIDGLLRTRFDNSNPNLFLMNPNGILFGPNASLDVQGSFHVTTADYLRLGDDGFFHADLNEKTTLSVAKVEAFGFTDAEVGNITVDQSQLAIPEGEILSIIGGDFDYVGGGRDINGFVNSFLYTNGGPINLASVSSPGLVLLSQNNLDMVNFAQLGGIKLSKDALINASGNGGGRIVIRGDSLDMDGALVVSNNLQDGNKEGEGINIDLTGSLLLENNSFIESGTFQQAKGNGGNLDIVAQQIELRNGALINVNTNTMGNGGNLNISSKNILLEGDTHLVFFTGITAQAGNSGNAGHLTIRAKQLEMRNSDIDTSTFGKGQAGELTIKAQQIKVHNLASIGANTFSDGSAGVIDIKSNGLLLDSESIGIFAEAKQNSTGNAGDITINAQQIEILNDAEISASTFASSRTSNAGNIKIEAERVSLTGDGSFGGIFSQSGNPDPEVVWDAGNAGNITIKGGDLNMRGSVQISTSTFSNQGKGGILDIDLTGEVTIIDESKDNTQTGLFSNTNRTGQGGSLKLRTTGDVVLDGGRILTRTLGNADAGSLKVKSANLQIINGGQIFSGIGNTGADFVGFPEGEGKGGDIVITVTDSLSIAGEDSRGFNSGIFSNAQTGNGSAGNIDVFAKTLEIKDGGQINSLTSTAGNGADIHIDAKEINVGNGSEISAASESQLPDAGVSGAVTIIATDSLNLTSDGKITVDTKQADAGNIHLSIGRLLKLNDRSAITTSAAVVNSQGTGDGGNININSFDERPNFAILDDSTQIVAQAQKGSGGDINIDVSSLFRSPDSIIDASSQFGQSGTVTINSPDSNLIDGALTLPSSFLDASSLLSQRCASRGNQSTSRFIITPLNSLQLAPGDYLSGYYSDTAAITRNAMQQLPENNKIPMNIIVGNDSQNEDTLDCVRY